MSEFCEVCPKRGDCEGTIEGIRLLSTRTYGSISEDGRTATMSFEYGVPQGPTEATVEYVDGSDGSSERFSFLGESVNDTERQIHGQIEKIDNCKGPARKRRLGIFSTKVCGATLDS